MSARLATRRLAVTAGRRTLVRDLELELAPGETLAILGRNGSGKTLTLRTLAGLRAPAAGRIELDGRDLDELPHRLLARHVGFLPQDPESGFVMTAEESVLIGRHPHLATLGWESERDRQIARRALSLVGLEGFGARPTDELSGGEQRRVAIAALLAQEPAVYLLDEPSNHLDPHQQLAVLELLRERAAAGACVAATLHDPNLAARFAQRVLLLFGDGRWRVGAAAELLSEAALSELYLTRIVAGEIGGRRAFLPA